MVAPAEWTDPANWDTGTVPNDPNAVAVLTAYTTGLVGTNVTTAPGTAPVNISSGSHTIGELRYQMNGGSSTQTGSNVFIGTATTAASLRIGNGGVRYINSVPAGFITPTLFVLNGSLEFAGQSTAGGDGIGNGGVRFTVERNGTLTFRDQSYAEEASFRILGVAEFRDNSRGGRAQMEIFPRGSLSFRDQASSGSGAIVAYGGEIHYTGSAVGSNTRIILSNANDGANFFAGRLFFQDQARGGYTDVAFNADATAMDISGLFAPGVPGGIGRGLLTQPDAAPVMVNDARSLVLRRITVLPGAAGTRIILGGNRLVVGEESVNIVVLPQLVELGGRFGSATGQPVNGGGLAKIGNGVLQISRPDSSYSGLTQIIEGELRFVGAAPRLPGMRVYTQGTLSGNGTVAGDLVNQHGWIKPGYENGYLNPGDGGATIVPASRIGTLRVEGNFIQVPGIADGSTPDQAVDGVTYVSNRPGNLVIDISSVADFDRLIVTGTANLAGTLRLQGLGSITPVGNSTLGFLTAASINGQFDTVLNPFADTALVRSRVVYSPTGVSLQFEQRPFAGYATTASGAALASYFDATLAGSTGAYRELIAGLNTLTTGAQVATALDALAPDRYAVLPENAFLAAAAQQAARDRLFAAARENPARGFDLFFEAGRRTADFEAVGGLPAAVSAASTGTVGGVWRNGGFALGASLAQEKGDVDLDVVGSRADLESRVPSAFFQYAGERYFLNVSGAISREEHELRRRVVFSGIDQTATATVSGSRGDFSLMTGARFTAGKWRFAPQAGVVSSRWELDRFTETGAAGANLSIGEWTVRSLRTRVGFEAGRAQGDFVPRLAVHWWRETDEDRALPAAFAGAAGSAYRAPGRPADENTIQATLGFDWRVGRNAVLHATVSGARGDHSRVTGDFSAGFRWSF